jgi:hypothetical protein
MRMQSLFGTMGAVLPIGISTAVQAANLEKLPKEALAQQGWMVKVISHGPPLPPSERWFAVGYDTGRDAETAVRAYLGIEKKDAISAHRQLSAGVTRSLKLKIGEVRWYA